MSEIQKVLAVGDTVYSPDGVGMEITAINKTGFYCGAGFIPYSEHGTTFLFMKAA